MNRRHLLLSQLCTPLMFALPASMFHGRVQAQPALDAAGHVALAWARYRQGVDTEEEHMQVRVTRQGQPALTKALIRWSRLSPQGDRVLVRFEAPAIDRGLGLLIVRNGTQRSQMWMRQPSWTQARRIASDREGRPFGGTDLSFEDNRLLLGEDTADFHYRLLPHTADGWLIEARPREEDASTYGMRHLVLTREHAVAEIRYFDRQLRPLKTQRQGEITVDPQGRWRAQTLIIEHHQDASQTDIAVVRRVLNPPLPERTFTPAALLDE